MCVLCIYISVEDLGLKWSFSGQRPQEKQWLLCSAAVSLLLYALQPAEYLQRGEYKVSASDEPQKQGNWQPLWGGKLVILPLIVYKFTQFPLHWSPLYLGCWEHPWVDEIGKWQLKTLCSEPWWPVLNPSILQQHHLQSNICGHIITTTNNLTMKDVVSGNPRSLVFLIGQLCGFIMYYPNTTLTKGSKWMWPSCFECFFPRSYLFTLWLFNIAIENGPFIDGLPIKNCDFPWLR